MEWKDRRHGMRTRAFVSLILALTLSVSIVTGAAVARGNGARGSVLPRSVAVTHLARSGSGSGSHPANHGSVVSKAAHTCPHGAHGVHGKCVRAVAKSSAGKK
jgi:hypothetical protein